MKLFLINSLIVSVILTLGACSQNNHPAKVTDSDAWNQLAEPVKVPTHRYGGWYCPDNLNGFPAVDLLEWKNVPVVNGRMATEEETKNGTSLILVDSEKYPNAKPLDMQMPRLATFDSPYSDRKELIIVIQALNIENDSVVGFRYLNGGNGSSRLNEVKFLSDQEIELMTATKFYTQSITIKNTADRIREVMTKPDYITEFQPILTPTTPLKSEWRSKTNVNYHYPKTGIRTSMYADVLFGNFYIQNDYEEFTEKFLLLYDAEKKVTELKIVCGPFGDDFKNQQQILSNWAQKLKEMSEKI